MLKIQVSEENEIKAKRVVGKTEQTSEKALNGQKNRFAIID